MFSTGGSFLLRQNDRNCSISNISKTKTFHFSFIRKASDPSQSLPLLTAGATAHTLAQMLSDNQSLLGEDSHAYRDD